MPRKSKKDKQSMPEPDAGEDGVSEHTTPDSLRQYTVSERPRNRYHRMSAPDGMGELHMLSMRNTPPDGGGQDTSAHSRRASVTDGAVKALLSGRVSDRSTGAQDAAELGLDAPPEGLVAGSKPNPFIAGIVKATLRRKKSDASAEFQFAEGLDPVSAGRAAAAAFKTSPPAPILEEVSCLWV